MRDSDDQIRQRLRAIELARDLGNVAEACRQTGIDRTSFYEWRRRYEAAGLAGLHDRPSIATSHPNAIPANLQQYVVDLAFSHPSWGCDRIARCLTGEGHQISGPTVQKLMNLADLGDAESRASFLERQQHLPALTREQAAFLAKHSPRTREFGRIGTAPAEIIAVGTIPMGRFPNFGRLVLHAAVDTYSCATQGIIDRGKSAEAATLALHQLLILLNRNNRFPTRIVLSPRAAEFTGPPGHSFSTHVDIWRIEHRFLPPASQPHGFIEQAARDAIGGTPSLADQLRRARTDRDILAALDFWLQHYNTRKVIPGFPNYGTAPLLKRPIPTDAEIEKLRRDLRRRLPTLLSKTLPAKWPEPEPMPAPLPDEPALLIGYEHIRRFAAPAPARPTSRRRVRKAR